MTTIADFLNKHQNRSLYKKADYGTWGILKPTRSQVEAKIKPIITPEYIRQGVNDFLKESPQYENLSHLANDPGLYSYLATRVPTLFLDYYETDKNTDWAEVEKQFKAKNIPGALKQQILTEAINYIKGHLNSPENLQGLYQLARLRMSPEEQAIVDRRVKSDPGLAASIGQSMIPYAQRVFKNGIANPSNEDIFQEASKALRPQVYSSVLTSGLNSLDMLPDTLAQNAGISEQAYLERNLFGNDPRFQGALSKYYDPKNPYRSNQVVFGLLNEFRNPNSPLRLAAIDHYRHLPESERQNSMLARWIRSMSSFANEMGQGTLRDTLDAVSKDLSANMGTYGKGFFGNETVDEEFGKQIGNYWGKTQNVLNSTDLGKQWLANWNKNKPTDAQNKDWNDYADDIRNRRLEDNYYGWFKDPTMQRVAQYAAPFAGYGLPLALLGSSMGVNLTPAILLGGLGAAGLRYAADNSMLGMNPETFKGMDEWMGAINGPLGLLGNMLPTGAKPAFNSVLGIKETPSETKTETTPTTSGSTSAPSTSTLPVPPAAPLPSTTTWNMPNTYKGYSNEYRPNNKLFRPTITYASTFSPTGTSRKYDWYPDPLNPSGVRSQKVDLGFEFA